MVNDLNIYFPSFQDIRASQLHSSLNPEAIVQTGSWFRPSTITAAAPVVNDISSLTNKQCTAMFIGILHSFDNVDHSLLLQITFILEFWSGGL